MTDATGGDNGTSYALLKRDPHWRPVVTARTGEDARSGDPKIRCPLCAWEPRPTDVWTCWACPVPEGLAEGCGTNWHTFDTGGRCPGCDHQWRWTTCLACGRWSRHVDWYRDE